MKIKKITHKSMFYLRIFALFIIIACIFLMFVDPVYWQNIVMLYKVYHTQIIFYFAFVFSFLFLLILTMQQNVFLRDFLFFFKIFFLTAAGIYFLGISVHVENNQKGTQKSKKSYSVTVSISKEKQKKIKELEKELQSLLNNSLWPENHKRNCKVCLNPKDFINVKLSSFEEKTGCLSLYYTTYELHTTDDLHIISVAFEYASIKDTKHIKIFPQKTISGEIYAPRLKKIEIKILSANATPLFLYEKTYRKKVFELKKRILKLRKRIFEFKRTIFELDEK